MTDIAAAQDRLQRALTRLESAQRALIDRPPPMTDDTRAATVQLIGSLEAVQRENSQLTALAEAIGDRLDKTIERIDTLLAADDLESSAKDAS